MNELPLNDDRIFLGCMDKQIGGSHYKKGKIQPVVFFEANRLPSCISNAIKYIVRYQDKNGRQDLEKAIHYVEMAAVFFREYGNPFSEDYLWRITPEEFIKAHKLDGFERDAIRCLCDVQNIGLEGYLTAHASLTALLRARYP